MKIDRYDPTPRQLSEAEIDLIRRTYCAEADDLEFRHFVDTCNRLGLSPIVGQIHFVKRWDSRHGRKVGRAQVSIDGFRLVAQRTGLYRGQTEPLWADWNGQWHDVWLGQDPPAAAKIGVYAHGNEKPLIRVATFESFCQRDKQGNPTAMWRQMADVMLLKCAEAQALRACFPHELGGVYAAEEMAQAYVADHEPANAQRAPEAQPNNVIDLRTAEKVAAGTGVIVEMFGAKLRQRMSDEQLISWALEANKGGYSDHVRKVLFGMWRKHVLACGYKPVELSERIEAIIAKGENSHE